MESLFQSALNNHAQLLGIFVLSIIVIEAIKRFLIFKLKAGEDKDAGFKNALSRSIKRIGTGFYLLIALNIAAHFANLTSGWLKIFNGLSLILGSYYALVILQTLIDYACYKIMEQRQKRNGESDRASITFFSRMIKILLWIIAVLYVLSNFGYNITALATGLGIGGVAIAFALQNILTDIFASFAIYFDQPFKVGDFIIFGQDMGTVKKIGIKTTRLETLEGQELIVANKELTSLHINNYKRMSRRRVVFGLSVPLETPDNKLLLIPDILKNIVLKQAQATLDRAHFSKIDDTKFSFEVVYYFASADYNTYMDTQQKINFEIVTEFRKKDIALAYPRQTVYVKSQ